MLIYHPRNDVYHCTLRILSIITILQERPIEFSKIRLIDFYFVFPHLATSITFPRLAGTSQLKKKASTFPDPYEKLPEKKRLFSEMGDYQIKAAHILAAKNIISIQKDQLILIEDKFHQPSLQSSIYNSIYLTNTFFSDLAQLFEELPLYGDDGLKRRTGLMEYRYDAI